ncbi:MAG: type I 3-dehydroquinate dehydratase [Candidatus Thorarchaeota archaeon]|nr:type I 3-dehydroquinate dehydratase [Candidatus Thorarchaeota archaeon]
MKLCLTVTGSTYEDCKKIMESTSADLFELRLDYFKHNQSFDELFSAVDRPIIATNRPITEGGMFHGSENERSRILLDAIDSGASFVDIEFDADPQVRQKIMGQAESEDCKVILSKHFFDRSPPVDHLHKLLIKMSKENPYIIKIVTMAETALDWLRVLNLYEYRTQDDPQLIAFAMGEAGRISRIAALYLGAPFMYVASNRFSKVAPGQIVLGEMRSILKGLNS